MEDVGNQRTNARYPSRLEAIVDYTPDQTTGRWWECFEARTADVGEGGFQLRTSVPVKAGGRLRLIVPASAFAGPPLTLVGRIAWVAPPRIPWLGTYRAGIVLDPPGQPGVEPLLERSGAGFPRRKGG